MSSFAPDSSLIGQWTRTAVRAQRRVIVIRQQLRSREGRVSKMATSRRERHVAILDTFQRCRCLLIVCRSASSSWAGASENFPVEPASTGQRSGDGWPARAISILPSRHGSRCWSQSMSPIPGQDESISRFSMALLSLPRPRTAEHVLAADTADAAAGSGTTRALVAPAPRPPALLRIVEARFAVRFRHRNTAC
jgi:hypothetical protein